MKSKSDSSTQCSFQSHLKSLLNALEKEEWDKVKAQVDAMLMDPNFTNTNALWMHGENEDQQSLLLLRPLCMQLCFRFMAYWEKPLRELKPSLLVVSTAEQKKQVFSDHQRVQESIYYALFSYHLIHLCYSNNIQGDNGNDNDVLVQCEVNILHCILWAHLAGVIVDNVLDLAAALVRIAENVLSFALAILVFIKHKQNSERVVSVFQEACKIIQINTKEQLHQFTTMVHCTGSYVTVSEILPSLTQLEHRLPNSHPFRPRITMLLQWLEMTVDATRDCTETCGPSVLTEFASMQAVLQTECPDLRDFNTRLLQLTSLEKENRSIWFVGLAWWIQTFSEHDHCTLLRLMLLSDEVESSVDFLKEYCALLLTYRVATFPAPIEQAEQWQLIFYLSCLMCRLLSFSTTASPSAWQGWLETGVGAYLGFLRQGGSKDLLACFFKSFMEAWMAATHRVTVSTVTLEQLVYGFVQAKEYRFLIPFIFWVEQNHPHLDPETWEQWASLVIYEKCPSAVQLTLAQCVLQAYIKDADVEKPVGYEARIALWFRIVIKSALVRNERVALDFLKQLPDLLEVIKFPQDEVIWLIQVAWNTALDFKSLKSKQALDWAQVALHIAQISNYKDLRALRDQLGSMKLEFNEVDEGRI